MKKLGILFIILFTMFSIITCKEPIENEDEEDKDTATNTVLAIPTGLKAIAESPYSITISWDAVSNATWYMIYEIDYQILNTLYYSFTDRTETNTYTHTGLTPDTKYVYRVVAHNSTRKSDLSDSVSAKTLIREPYTPFNIKAEVNSSSSITITWSKLKDTDEYKIYRSLSEEDEYELIYTTIESSYTDTGLTEETEYFYKISGLNSTGEGSLSNSVSAITLSTKTPINVVANIESSTSIVINWSSVENALGYKVYRSLYISGDYTEIGISFSTDYTDIELNEDTTYYYKVSAYGSDWEGPHSPHVSARTPATIPSAPINVSATSNSTSSITITWESVSNASGYKIYRSNIVDGDYIQIGSTTTSTSYNNNYLPVNTTYYYKVLAYNLAGESPLSEYISATTLKNKPSSPSGLLATADSSSSITISWNEVSEADGYYIYSSSSSYGTYTKVGESLTTSYTNNELTPNTTYYYRVSAFNNGGEGNQSSYVYVKTNNAPPNTPSGLFVINSHLRMVNISWFSVSNVDRYRIYRSINVDTGYTDITTTYSNSYIDNNSNSGLVSGMTYYYKVSAYNEAGESELSSPVSITIPETTQGTSPANAISLSSSGVLGYFPQGMDEIWFTFTRIGAGAIYAEDRDYKDLSGIFSSFTGDIVVDVGFEEDGVIKYASMTDGINETVLQDIDIGNSTSVYIGLSDWNGKFYVRAKPSTKNLITYRGTFMLYFVNL